MNKKDYISIDDPEICGEAYDFIFSRCDSIEYLNEDGCGQIGVIEELCSTGLEGLIPAYIGCQSGESWGMQGNVYTFALTDEVKQIVRRSRLENSLRAADGNIIFQNAALYSGGEAVFSCCSHEGLHSYYGGFEDELAEVCCSAIEKSNCYRDMLEVFEIVRKDAKDCRAREKCVLSFTGDYVKQAGNAPVYTKPPYDCTFAEYKRIAKKYLQAEVFSLLDGAKNFSDLHPNGYPQHYEEDEQKDKFKDCENEIALVSGIKRNLFYLKYIEDKFADGTDGVKQEWTPTIIFSQPYYGEMTAYFQTKMQDIKGKG